MKIRRITSLIAAAAFGVGIGAVVVTTSGASAAASTTVHVQEVATNATYVPVQQLLASKSQTNRGDYIAFNDRLYFPSTGTVPAPSKATVCSLHQQPASSTARSTSSSRARAG